MPPTDPFAATAEPPPPVADGPLREKADALSRWLLTDAHRYADVGELLREFCERVGAAGVPLARSAVILQTNHPTYRGAMRTWTRGKAVELYRAPRNDTQTEGYTDSPMHLLRVTGRWIVRRLDEQAAAERDMFAELRGEGYTHYMMAPMRFADGSVNGVSWTTTEPKGFDAAQLGLLAAVLPAFSAACEIKVVRRISGDLLRSYVGENPAERIEVGTVRVGDLLRIEAAIVATDLRGFTTLAARLDEETLVTMLNAYFDCVVPAIRSRGGEVLKFIGDGVLAIFADERLRGARRACRAALEAAREAHATLDVLNGAPSPWAASLTMGVSLHHGEAVYGNIGSADRLDFTVIGRDVNLASRIEGLCGPLGEPILMSAAFAALSGDAARPRGAHPLKGFAEPQAVFAPSAPAAPA